MAPYTEQLGDFPRLLAGSFVVRDRLQQRDNPTEPKVLLARPYQPAIWLVVIPALIALIILSARVDDLRGALPVDQSVDDRLIYRFRNVKGFFLGIIQLGSPTGVVVLSMALGLFCIAGRNGRAAIFVAAGPPAAGALTEYVLKPLIGRSKGAGLAFPSGHTTGAVSVAVALAILLLPGGVLAHKSGRIRALLLALTLLLVGAVPLGLVVIQYHYVTDIFGGFAVASIAMILFALTLDRAAAFNSKFQLRNATAQSGEPNKRRPGSSVEERHRC